MGACSTEPRLSLVLTAFTGSSLYVYLLFTIGNTLLRDLVFLVFYESDTSVVPLNLCGRSSSNGYCHSLDTVYLSFLGNYPGASSLPVEAIFIAYGRCYCDEQRAACAARSEPGEVAFIRGCFSPFTVIDNRALLGPESV